jgi:hypothetical protein
MQPDQTALIKEEITHLDLQYGRLQVLRGSVWYHVFGGVIWLCACSYCKRHHPEVLHPYFGVWPSDTVASSPLALAFYYRAKIFQ